MEDSGTLIFLTQSRNFVTFCRASMDRAPQVKLACRGLTGITLIATPRIEISINNTDIHMLLRILLHRKDALKIEHVGVSFRGILQEIVTAITSLRICCNGLQNHSKEECRVRSHVLISEG